MSTCYCIHEKVTSTCCCSCDQEECAECLLNEINLVKLKNTNYELKDLIAKLDKLSTSVDSNLLHAPSKSYHEHCSRTIHRDIYLDKYKCNICQSANEYNKKDTYQYDITICDKCKKMIKLAEVLEERKKLKKDPRVYPLSSYPSGRQYSCDKCERCISDGSRSRSRQRSRSRHRSRSFSSSSYSPVRVQTPEPRPIWNGGPWVSNYLWRDFKLKEEKK